MKPETYDRPHTGDGPSVDWPEISPKGEIVKNSLPNVRAFLGFLGLELWLDQFENRVRIDGSEESQYLDAHVLAALWGRANEFGFRPSMTFVRQALMSIAVGNGRHPLREFLKGLRWDGVPRVERLLVDYAHAEDNLLNRAIAKLLLVAMVRRIFEPGCKFDCMVVLQGPQGCGKSLFCKVLAGDFFEESMTLAASAKEIMEQTPGKWVVEIAELSGLNAKDVEHQKALVTRTEDRARRAYGYFAESAPRQFVLVATTNESVFLHDATGNRRYLPVRVSNIDIEALKRDREQLLAEAVELEKTHGPLIMPPELTAELIRRQEEVTIVDDARERLNDYITEKLSANPDYMFRKDELFTAMGVTTPKSKDGKVLAHSTRQFGMRETKRTINGRRIRVFVRQEAAETEGQRAMPTPHAKSARTLGHSDSERKVTH